MNDALFIIPALYADLATALHLQPWSYKVCKMTCKRGQHCFVCKPTATAWFSINWYWLYFGLMMIWGWLLDKYTVLHKWASNQLAADHNLITSCHRYAAVAMLNNGKYWCCGCNKTDCNRPSIWNLITMSDFSVFERRRVNGHCDYRWNHRPDTVESRLRDKLFIRYTKNQ
jgi:hypothetical protein